MALYIPSLDLPSYTTPFTTTILVMAGFITLMNSARLAAGKPLLGFVNPLLYSANISAPNSVNYANNFYDITSGILFRVY